MTDIVYELYRKARQTECEDCGHMGCDLKPHRYGVSFICEECNFENRCVDVDASNEAAVYY
jgi:hypothetical protein